MGMRFIELLVVAIIAINTAITLGHDIGFKNAPPNRSLLRVTTTKRSLRVEKTAVNLPGINDSTDSENSEERANVQGLSKLAVLDKKTWKRVCTCFAPHSNRG
ncbi:Putative RxLR effector [Phytophthora palmivora]|uniref:RxLR effector n=1 Tax=Phytophthora palmivora TaxID=4796 RepID=A0A2P4XLS1_9STRA|nr:Putative RxLR effector [Phytophthora palmivora]